VPTSAESIAFLEEKQHKKQEKLGTEAKNVGPKQRATQQVPNSPETGIQHRELSENKRAICIGLHEEDPEPCS